MYSKNLSRVKSIYSNVPEKTIKEHIRQIHYRIEKYQTVNENLFPLNELNLKEFLNKNILPIDAGVLQFSSFKTDVLELEESILEEIIFEQHFIDDIKALSNQAQEPRIISHLFDELKKHGYQDRVNKTRVRKDYNIKTNTGNFSFDFAWKNGVWNLVKPVGFDLKTPEGIISKARNNLGEFIDLNSEIDNKEYKSNIIVGRPTNRSLYKAYDNALSILHKLPNTEIIEEKNLKQYSEKILDAVSKNDN